MDSAHISEAGASAAPAEKPSVYLIACFKCCREYELHGRESLLKLNLEYEGWVRMGDRNCCPWCLAPSETPQYNKARELTRQARRQAC